MKPTPSAAELAVLDAALAEEFGELPPDMWARLSTQAGTQVNPATLDRPTLWPRWLVAAFVFIGLAVVVATAMQQSIAVEPVSANPVQEAQTDPTGPASLAELKQWLAGNKVRGATIHAKAVFSPELGRSVLLSQQPLEGLLDFTSQSLRFDDRMALGRALTAAVALDVSASQRPWEHDMRLDIGNHTCILRMRTVEATSVNATLQLAIVGSNGLFGLAIDGVTADLLRDEAQMATAATVQKRGIAIADRGLAALPATMQRLRLHGVSATAAARLAEFTALESLDLRDAPACHSQTVLQHAAALPLRSLMLDAEWLNEATVAAVSQCTSLRELFFMSAGSWQLSLPDRSMPALNDAAMAKLASLSRLQELVLSGANITDAGLAQLAPLTELRRLGLGGCRELHGHGLQAFVDSKLESVDLRGCTSLDAGGMQVLVGLPSLRRLAIGTPGQRFDLAVLQGMPALHDLFVHGTLQVEDLAAVQAMASLRKLVLWCDPPIDDGDLFALQGATQLERIELLNNDAITEQGLTALRAALPECRISIDRW